MVNKEFVEGINIIGKYAKDDEYSLVAEHDQIWFGDFDIVGDEDKKRLIELGWFESMESWSCYV